MDRLNLLHDIIKTNIMYDKSNDNRFVPTASKTSSELIENYTTHAQQHSNLLAIVHL